MRLFLGIALPPEIQESLCKQFIPLIKDYPEFQWIEPSLYHVTLQFYGASVLPENVKEAVEQASFDVDPFPLYAGRAGLLLHHDLTLWVEYNRSPVLSQLIKRLDQAFPTIERAESYVCHTTIGRTRIPSKQQYLHLKKKIQRLPIEAEFMVDRLVLFSSQRAMAQRQYTVQQEYLLGQG